jgi:hypothetical protein
MGTILPAVNTSQNDVDMTVDRELDVTDLRHVIQLSLTVTVKVEFFLTLTLSSGLRVSAFRITGDWGMTGGNRYSLLAEWGGEW